MKSKQNFSTQRGGNGSFAHPFLTLHHWSASDVSLSSNPRTSILGIVSLLVCTHVIRRILTNRYKRVNIWLDKKSPQPRTKETLHQSEWGLCIWLMVNRGKYRGWFIFARDDIDMTIDRRRCRWEISECISNDWVGTWVEMMILHSNGHVYSICLFTCFRI